MGSFRPTLPFPLLYWITILLLNLTHSFVTAIDQFRTTKFQNDTYQTLITLINLSKNDKRQYEGIILSNKLEVLLISDDEVDYSAAALDVKVGSQSDPKSLPGLAHFCEHLLFMGNEKYPDEDDYFKYLQTRSGDTNAYTDYEDTNYFFHVKNDALEGSLDRFVQFFISPLMKEDTINREVESIDSEFKKYRQNDENRIEQAQKLVSNPDYPYSYFPIGNKKTLSKLPKSKGIDVRKKLLRFYNSYYSSNRMKLVVIGKEPLSKLRMMVIPRFSKIPNRNLKAPIYTGNPFTKHHLGIQINIVPVEDSSLLMMRFQLPSQQEYYNEKPTDYLSYMMEYQGTGSLTANLVSRNWVSGSSSSLKEDHTTFSIFQVRFELTPIGYKYSDEIIELTFAYLKLIQKQGISKKFFDEMKADQTYQFQYLEKEESMNYAYDLAAQLHSPAPLSQIISSKHIITSYNASLMRKTLKFLNPKNMRIILVSPSAKKLKNLKKEPYYGTQYSVTRIPLYTLKKWKNVKIDSSLKLPETSSSNLEPLNLIKIPNTSKIPVLLKNQTGLILWYTTGNITVPKVSLRLIIKNNRLFQSPVQMARLELLINFILEDLNSIEFMALQDGLDYELKAQYPGIAIKVEGFSNKAEKLMTAIVDRVCNFTITQRLFDLAKAKATKDQIKFNNQAPYKQAIYYLNIALKENSWTNDQLATVTSQLTKSDLIKFQRHNINRGSLELMVLGNFDETRAHSLLDKIQSILKLQAIEPRFECAERAVVMKNHTNLMYTIPGPNKDEMNSAIVFYLDMYAYPDAQQNAIVRLIAQMIKRFAFNQLRTKEQLGYIVHTENYSIATRGGIVIIVQSELDPSYLESRIENMLNNFVKETTNITDEAFQLQVQSLQTSMRYQQRDLRLLSDYYWDIVISGYADFRKDETILHHLESLTKPQFLQVIKNMISLYRRKLSIHILADKVKTTTQLNSTVIPNLLKWRKRQALSDYPRPQPHTLTHHHSPTTTSSFNRTHQGSAKMEV